MIPSAASVLQAISDKHIAPESVLGARIHDRPGLIATLSTQARILTRILVGAYLCQFGLVIFTIVCALRPALGPSAKVLPYLSGAVLLGLLEFSRRVTREWLQITLALRVAPHASNEQLATLITSLLTVFGDGGKHRSSLPVPASHTESPEG
jgi:hypothetical protein